jgi:hypothetical protein
VHAIFDFHPAFLESWWATWGSASGRTEAFWTVVTSIVPTPQAPSTGPGPFIPDKHSSVRQRLGEQRAGPGVCQSSEEDLLEERTSELNFEECLSVKETRKIIKAGETDEEG